MPGIVQMVTPRSPLAFSFRSADIEAGGWRWTSHSPTGSDPEGSSPNERGSGRSSASHPHTDDVARIERSEMRGQPTRSHVDPDFALLNPGYDQSAMNDATTTSS